MPKQYKQLTTKQKSLAINLDNSIYGAFAEIGAGQEVVRHFFQAGGASGTIAKAISAYDMTCSDSIYGKAKRYVCENRLKQMLDKEYTEVIDLLSENRAFETRYFAYANTISAINYKKTNQGHGWMGVRFQIEPEEPYNEVLLHIKMHDNDNRLQQRNVGIVGVNLLYACYHYYNNISVFLDSLLDSTDNERIEIDMIHIEGPQFKYIDNRLLSVMLVKKHMTNVTVFNRNGEIQSPMDMFYKKHVLLLRGSFRPITYVGFDMLKTGFAMLKNDIGNFDKDKTMIICEISINNLLEDGFFDERDFLDRADLLCGMGQNVMISNYSLHYKLINYFSKFKLQSLGVIIGVLTLKELFNKQYYKNLQGGILEGFGKLFIDKMKLYVYPFKKDNDIITIQKLKYESEIQNLADYLYSTGKLIDIEGVNKEKLYIFSKTVLAMIQNNDNEWENMVPKYVSKTIKEKQLFGYNVE